MTSWEFYFCAAGWNDVIYCDIRSFQFQNSSQKQMEFMFEMKMIEKSNTMKNIVNIHCIFGGSETISITVWWLSGTTNKHSSSLDVIVSMRKILCESLIIDFLAGKCIWKCFKVRINFYLTVLQLSNGFNEWGPLIDGIATAKHFQYDKLFSREWNEKFVRWKNMSENWLEYSLWFLDTQKTNRL